MSVKMQRRLAAGVCALALACAATTGAKASSTQPAGINLGGTSFNDGFGGLTPGWAYVQIAQYQHFDAINDENGKAIGAFKDPGIDAYVALNQLLYTSPVHIFGGVLAATALLPVIDLNAQFAQSSPVKLKANGFGVGDLTFGPYLQMPPVIANGRPIFSQRFEFDAIAPIGTYNKHADLNQSAGFWSLNPYYAFSVLPTPQFTFSARLHYLYNFANNNPAGSGPAFTIPASYQAGQAVWTNFTASYNFTRNFEVGVAGYYFQQITRDKTNGIVQAKSETTNFSMGPGAFWFYNPTNLIEGEVYAPVIEKNTTSGVHVVVRYLHIF
jgi:hypothetical protein